MVTRNKIQEQLQFDILRTKFSFFSLTVSLNFLRFSVAKTSLQTKKLNSFILSKQKRLSSITFVSIQSSAKGLQPTAKNCYMVIQMGKM